MNELERNPAFAAKLKQLMEARELTQSALAAEIWGRRVNDDGVLIAKGRDRISVWASGKAFPDEANLAKLAHALDVKPDELAPKSEP